MSMNDATAGRKVQIRTLFNTIAPDYDAGPGCFAHFGRRLVAAAGIAPGQHVLDVASGLGAVLFPAAEQAGPTGAVTGIDLSDEMARAANAAAERRGLSARVRVMDAENLDFPDAAFDRVLCGFGVMFFPDQIRALSEFRRVLKADGLLAVSTWRISQTNELQAILPGLGVTLPRPPGWIADPDELSQLLTRAGFTNVRVQADSQAFRYADVDEYWQQARGTGMRRALDTLDAGQAERVRAALAERVRAHQGLDGFEFVSTALLAVAKR
jgi:ubiquinone/menaquinone biosynthesis C-methylase UbiE